MGLLLAIACNGEPSGKQKPPPIDDSGDTSLPEDCREDAERVLGSTEFMTVGWSGSDYSTIQAALDASPTGTTIYACPATYTEGLVASGGQQLKLVGESPDLVVLDGGGTRQILTVSGATYLEVIGIALTNGSADMGGAVFATGDGTVVVLDQVEVSNSQASYGGAIAVTEGAEAAVFDTLLTGNVAGQGGVFFVDGGTVNMDAWGEMSVEGNSAEQGAVATVLHGRFYQPEAGPGLVTISGNESSSEDFFVGDGGEMTFMTGQLTDTRSSIPIRLAGPGAITTIGANALLDTSPDVQIGQNTYEHTPGQVLRCDYDVGTCE